MKTIAKTVYLIRARLLHLASLLVLVFLALNVIPRARGQAQAGAASPKVNAPETVCTPGWSAGPDMPSAGIRLAGVYFPANGKFYEMGGRVDDSASEFTHPFEYEPVANSWTTKAATYPDNAVSNMACGVLNDSGTDYIYCVGGNAFGMAGTGRVFRYNPVTDTISSVPSPWPPGTTGGNLPGGFSVFQNKLYILGGGIIPTGLINQIWEFTPTTNVWVQKSAVLPVPLAFIPTATIGSHIYTGGGSTFDGTNLIDTNNSFVYDPVADSLSTIASIPRATGETRALNFRGKMYVMGGGRTQPNPSSEVDVYDPVVNTWSLGPAFMTARFDFPTDTDGTRRIWLSGGYVVGPPSTASMEIFCGGPPAPRPRPTPAPRPTPRAQL